MPETREIAPVDWEQLLLVYMHDPVDKALDIRGHETRAARYASSALGRSVDRSEIKSTASLADQLAAIAERIPMPTAGPSGERAVGPDGGRIEARHPVSAQPYSVDAGRIDEAAVSGLIANIVDGLPDMRSRFLALWRLLPERLEQELGRDAARLPADTRVPDHTIFHHADITSGIWASRSGVHGGAYLSFSLGPVQPFISAARTVRDLWSGSATLSWLVFQAMTPVIEALGPTAFVFPSLRGAPLMDLWLKNEGGLADLDQPDVRALRSPSIPNRFVALVPWGEDGRVAQAYADACTDRARSAWRSLAGDVRSRLEDRFSAADPGWARHWDGQVDSFFEFRVSAIPERALDDTTLADLIEGERSFETVWPDAAAVRGLAGAIPGDQRPGYDQRSSGRWQAQLEASARLMEARRSVRHVPSHALAPDEGPFANKCSLLGSYEQMGPGELDASRRFWTDARERVSVDGVRLRGGERFSAVALCKRFAAPARLAKDLSLSPSDLRFPDTATIAAAEWLKGANIDPDGIRRRHGDWSGRWLHEEGRGPAATGEEPPPDEVARSIREATRSLGRPPSYYAILMMDADNMGLWLRGEKAPRLREVLHPRMAGYYADLDSREADAGLDALRPVGPALHASISDALKDFAVRVVPDVVEKHEGTLIYSGGDDVMALLPVRQAVACAASLRMAFRGDGEGTPGWTRSGNREWMMMGANATVSAGIVFVHMMDDLRLALQAAREEEKRAKTAGRDLLSLRFMRRSGEHASALLPWHLATWFEDLAGRFSRGATNRWTYRLRSELPTLMGPGLPDEAVRSEIGRLVDRTRDDGAATEALAGEEAENWWADYRQAFLDRGQPPSPEHLEAFTILCQGAAFVARGNDA